MKAWQQNALIIGLSATAGALDCWSYFGLKHVFVANMTGNVVLFGFTAATQDFHRSGASLLALAAYGLGVFGGTWLSRPVRAAFRQAREAKSADEQLWPARTTFLLKIELLLILLAAMLDALHEGSTGRVGYVFLAIVAFAVGLQSATMQSMKLPGIVTTYITGTWTTLVGGVARLFDGEKTEVRRGIWEKRLLLQSSVLTALLRSRGPDRADRAQHRKPGCPWGLSGRVSCSPWCWAPLSGATTQADCAM